MPNWADMSVTSDPKVIEVLERMLQVKGRIESGSMSYGGDSLAVRVAWHPPVEILEEVSKAFPNTPVKTWSGDPMGDLRWELETVNGETTGTVDSYWDECELVELFGGPDEDSAPVVRAKSDIEDDLFVDDPDCECGDDEPPF